jgi:hypothetical protein
MLVDFFKEICNNIRKICQLIKLITSLRGGVSKLLNAVFALSAALHYIISCNLMLPVATRKNNLLNECLYQWTSN